MTTSRRLSVALLATVTAAGVLTGVGVAAAQPGADAGGARWSGSWVSSQMRATTGFEPNWSLEGFADQTVRQVVRVTAGGAAARIRLSNVYGATPLRVAGATIARPADGAAVQPNSLRHLTFRHSRSVVVPVGGEVASDPAVLRVSPLESLTVTLYLAAPTGPATFHPSATANSYRAGGDHRADQGATAFTETSRAWYYLAGVDTIGLVPRRDGIVAFGDSITDGFGATVESNRYPDELAEILAAQRKPRAVVNAGIGGNRVLSDSTCAGNKALTRFTRDAVNQPSVSTVIVLEGINDIGASEIDFECFRPNPRVTVAELIAGHRELIRQARARGLTVIGATLLPYKGALYFTDRGEAVRDELNTWIRTSGEYDAVVDLDRVMAAPGDPDLLNPAYDVGDRLHPNDAGYHAIAEAVAPAIR